MTMWNRKFVYYVLLFIMIISIIALDENTAYAKAYMESVEISNPEVYAITPQEGPATGGTRIRITGNNFMQSMETAQNGKLKVYFKLKDRDIVVENINYINSKTIEVFAPYSNAVERASIKVENPDGGISREEVYFKYISRPRIKDVSPDSIFTNDTETEITIAGEMFMAGAKVILGGEIVDIEDITSDMDVKGQGISGVYYTGDNIRVAVVGGIEADANVQADNIIKVRFSYADNLENYNIVIINPDGGISNVYEDFEYKTPIPTRPMLLEGIPGYESTVTLLWSKSSENILNKATRYEIYGRTSKESTYTFVGDTTNWEFLVKGLKPNTEYVFMVRALNEYGAAMDFSAVRVKTLTAREDKRAKEKENRLKKEDEELKQEGKEEIKADRVVKLLGLRDIRMNFVDLSTLKYDDYDRFTISIPVEYIRSSRDFKIKDGTLTLMLNLKDLYTSEVAKNYRNKDAYVNIHIERQREYRIPRGKKTASKSYSIFFSYQYGRDEIGIDKLVRPARLMLELDENTYKNAKNASLYVFNAERGQYVKAGSDWADVDTLSKLILLSDVH